MACMPHGPTVLESSAFWVAVGIMSREITAISNQLSPEVTHVTYPTFHRLDKNWKM